MLLTEIFNPEEGFLPNWEVLLSRLANLPRFKAWFRQSVLKTDSGLPQVCFHFGQGDYRAFRAWTHFGTSEAAEMRFLSKRDFARINSLPFRPGHTTPVLLSLQKPYWIEDLGGHLIEHYVEALRVTSPYESGDPLLDQDAAEAILEAVTRSEAAAFELLRRHILATGHDGFGYYNEVEGDQSWIILKPSQALPLLPLVRRLA
jgi:hypothetical protein